MAELKRKSRSSADVGNIRGRETRDRILAAAERLLVEVGYHRFSQRLVAVKAGISPGNLTFHFPTKADLVKGLVTAVFKRYSAEFERLLPEGKPHVTEDVVGLVIDLVKDSSTEETGRLGRELWAMASHFPAAAEAMNAFYAGAITSIADRLGGDYPAASVRERERVAYAFALLTEGAIVVLSKGSGMTASEIAPLVERTVRCLLESLPTDPRPRRGQRRIAINTKRAAIKSRPGG